MFCQKFLLKEYPIDLTGTRQPHRLKPPNQIRTCMELLFFLQEFPWTWLAPNPVSRLHYMTSI